MQLFVGMGEGIDVDLWLHKEDPGRTQTKLQYKLRWNKIKMKQTDDTSQDFDDLQSAIDSGFYLKQGLSSGDEFAYMATMLTITGKSVKEIEYKFSEVKRICAQSDMKIKQCLFQQEAAFQSSIPICEYNANIFRKSRRNILTSDFGSTYLFVSSELNDEGGILMGVIASINLRSLSMSLTAESTQTRMLQFWVPLAQERPTRWKPWPFG